VQFGYDIDWWDHLLSWIMFVTIVVYLVRRFHVFRPRDEDESDGVHLERDEVE
jgi:hypothetical protein